MDVIENLQSSPMDIQFATGKKCKVVDPNALTGSRAVFFKTSDPDPFLPYGYPNSLITDVDFCPLRKKASLLR